MTTNQLYQKRKKKVISFQAEEKQQDDKSFIDGKLRKIFKSHIGEENGIKSEELFFEVYERNTSSFPIYQRSYLWNLIKSLLRENRKTETMFTVRKGNKYFVLKSKEELKYFNVQMDNHIQNILQLKTKAGRWVRNKSYLRF